MAGPLIGRDQLGNSVAITINSVDQSIITTPVQNQSPSVADTSISITALSLLTSALRLIGVLASGEQPDISTANEALVVLDQMIDGWNADRLAIFTTRSDDFALIGGQQNYTMGVGGDFNTNRPARIDNMSVLLPDNPTNPIEIPISMYSIEQWQTRVPVKNVSGSFPLICYDDGGFPQRTLQFWPIPQGQPCSVRIYSWQSLGLASAALATTDQLGFPYSVTVQSGQGGLQVQSITNQWPLTLQTTISFPPGYAEALRYNLAVRLGAEFAAPASPTVQALAIDSFARIKTMNAPDLGMQSDLIASPAGYNWRADMFGIPY